MITYALCHASYRNGLNSIRVRDAWLRESRIPSRVRHFLGFERGDLGVGSAYGVDSWMSSGKSADGLTQFRTTLPDDSVSAVRNWNAAASISTGDVLITIADDLVPSKDWDLMLDEVTSKHLGKRRVFSFTDDRCLSLKSLGSDTLLPRHPGLTREAYRELGYLFSPVYDSVGPDLEILIESLRRGWLVDARCIKYHHSFNQVIDTTNELLCGCAEKKAEPKRGSSQNLIHRDSTTARELLEKRWGKTWVRVATLACVNRLADFVYLSMKADRNNRPTVLATSAIFRYVFYKFID